MPARFVEDSPDMNTKRFLIGLSLAIWVCGGTALAAKDQLPPRHPVQDIGARIVMANGGSLAVPFRIGTVRFRLPSASLDLPLDDLQSIRYTDGGDECKIVTVYGDVLVGRCPFKEFRNLLKSADVLADQPDDPVAIAFAHPQEGTADAARTADTPWVLSLANGTLLHARPLADALPIESDAGTFLLPWSLAVSVFHDTTTDLLDVRLADAPYAVRSYLPRPALQVADAANRTISVPWSEVVSFADAERNTGDTPFRFSQTADAFDTNGTPRAIAFPVSVLVLRGATDDILLPSTRLLRIVRNEDRTHTVFTAAGDILTGRLSFPELPETESTVLSAAPIREAPVKLDEAARIEFHDTDVMALSDTIGAWRLSSGDIVVGEWDRGDEAEEAGNLSAAPVATAAASRIAAVAAAIAATPSSLPQARADGTWPEKRYSVRLAVSGATLEVPSKILEAVRPLPVASLPPARIPAGPSAMASDEVRFDGGTFHLGRASGEGPADEVPAVNVHVPPFFIANTPVTVAQFRAFVDDTGYKTIAETAPGEKTWIAPGFAQTDDDPVVCIAWIDAANYCNWRSKRARLDPAYTIRDGGRSIVLDLSADGYRLPLEAEWEYAARNGGKDILFPWGDEATEADAQAHANFRPEELFIDPWPTTNPVKAFPAQPDGLYGMAGNVWEWCQDLYVPNAYATAYRSGAIESLLNPDPGAAASTRVMRGGSYFNRLPFLRCTTRGYGHEQVGAPRVGLRVARNAD